MTPAELTAAFASRYGAPPVGVWAAPGRVNLIGEHTDYADGYCLPLALAESCLAAVAPRADGVLRAGSLDVPGELTAPVADLAPGATEGWAAYVAGVVWALREAGHDVGHDVGGADVLLTSTVPTGSGLSSSAALECSVGLALDEIAGLGLDRPALAARCRRAENAYVGAPTGVMDQMASLCCTAGHALFLDCRTLDVDQVPLAPADAGLALLVIDTRAPHRHADGEYADRSAAAGEAARALGVPALRDVAAADLDAALARLDERLRPRVRHVVTENARVLAATERLRAGDWPGLGALMTASHASLRDDYEVSCTELDDAVDAALGAGALGARMTGGGFGGCAVALVAADREDAVRDAVRAAYAGRGHREPGFLTATAGPGAHRVA